MNIDAINTLADLLENLPAETKQGFNMTAYLRDLSHDYLDDDEARTNVQHQCGTVACIAGWGAQYVRMDGKGLLKKPRPTADNNAEFIATEVLGLTPREADRLFEPMNTGPFDVADVAWGEITPHDAAKVLRHLAATGEVDWSIALTS